MISFTKKIALFFLVGIPIGILFILPCFFILPYQTGDIGRLGGIPFGPYDTIFEVPNCLFTGNIKSYDSLQNVEILTIGDSFSQGGVVGYQNYLGKCTNKKIGNFRISGVNSIDAAATLIEKEKIPNCKVVIIESVERLCITDLSKGVNITNDVLNREIISGMPSILQLEDTITRHSNFVFKDLTSYYKNKINVIGTYKVFTLSIPMFTAGKYSDKLYIYSSRLDINDLKFSNITQQQIQKAKETLSKLKQLGEQHNVQIIYLVAADKYDMYYDYIKDNSYPANPTLDYFSDIDTTFFINTKTLLLPYLKNGEKDIYRVNDTHWSPKAAKIVGEHLGRIIKDKHTL